MDTRLTQGAEGRSCEGVTFPVSIALGAIPLTLNGMGVREATLFKINVFVAGLYLERPSRDGRQVIESPGHKRMHMVFVRNADHADVAAGLQKSFRDAVGKDLAAIQKDVDAFKALLPDFRSGDQLIVSYFPGGILDVEVRTKAGSIVNRLKGEAFARALFSVWLGAHPPNESLKQGLLGGACG